MNTDYSYFPSFDKMMDDEKMCPEAKDFMFRYKSAKTSPEIMYAIVQIAQDVSHCEDILYFPHDEEILAIGEKVTKNGRFKFKEFKWLNTNDWA